MVAGSRRLQARQARRIARYFFKPSHVELVLGAAGLADGPIDEAPVVVAALIERTAVAMGAPFETAAEIRAAASVRSTRSSPKVEAERQNGGLMPYPKFLQRFTGLCARRGL